ncbi:hypothetical protein [Streptomyces rubellomurinus]|uniref:Uncharacterized protein n=1 Tax=Streptomyces sp. Y1 TaxID=3238634 RepID=A0AB39TV53_9ACTN|nr:hypothetical protein [Streptomyces rubellomurinus]
MIRTRTAQTAAVAPVALTTFLIAPAATASTPAQATTAGSDSIGWVGTVAPASIG